MKKPLLQDEAFLENVKETKTNFKGFDLWWLGQSGFLIRWAGKFILIDPYLSDSLTKKYAETDKPHVRMTERVVAPEKLDFIDAVTSSHNHTDHFDPETLNPLMEANPKMKVVVPEANRAESAKRLGVDPELFVGMDSGRTKSVGGFRIHGVPAAHNELDTNEWDEHLYIGYIIEFGMVRIYHAGDTLLYEGMENWIRPFRPNVAILPINGNKPERRVAGNLDGKEAAKLAKDIGARVVIPCHYDMFEFNTVEPDEFVAACKELDQPYAVLQNGEKFNNSQIR